MQFSLMTYTVGPGQPGGLPDLAAIADFAAEVEFAALELSAGHLTDMSPADFGAMCADRDLAVSCINGGCPMTSADEAEFQAGVDQAKQYVDWAVAMDCPVVMLLPGPALNEADKERTRNRIAEGLNLVMSHANGAGIVVTLEDFPNPLTPYCSIADLQWMFAQVPGLQLTFDNGNFMLGGDDPLTALQTLGDSVANVHIKDWEVNPAGQGMRLPDGRYIRGGLHGQGLIEHQPIFAEFARQGYDGYLAFEYEGPMDHCEATRQGLEYLRGVLAEVQ
jgi:sugar phosphate isomerase/epimerase